MTNLSQTIEKYIQNCKCKTIFFQAGGCTLTLRDNGNNEFKDANGNFFMVHKWFTIMTVYNSDLTLTQVRVAIENKDGTKLEQFYMVLPSVTYIHKDS